MGNDSSAIATLPRGTPDIADATFQKIASFLKGSRGISIGCYKDKCIKRRIAIRIRATHCISAEEYYELVEHDVTELERLVKVLTIHVSQFFRNAPTFAKLQDEIFPYLFRQRCMARANGLRIWSVGCASGEEPYSIALLLKEYFAAELESVGAAILASDIDAGILALAKLGLFAEDRIQDVPDKIMRRWFSNNSGKFQLAQEIISMVTFRQSDIFDVSSYEEQDLILCRNVLIYFERNQQEIILNSFADALHGGGVLVLGKSETLVGDTRRRFQTICPVERIYRVA